jgi:hypothetical protein
MSRAVKHWMISAGAGLDESLNKIREGFMNGMQRKLILRRLCALTRHLKMK